MPELLKDENLKVILNHILKWKPLSYSFVYLLIRPTNLILKQTCLKSGHRPKSDLCSNFHQPEVSCHKINDMWPAQFSIVNNNNYYTHIPKTEILYFTRTELHPFFVAFLAHRTSNDSQLMTYSHSSLHIQILATCSRLSNNCQWFSRTFLTFHLFQYV